MPSPKPYGAVPQRFPLRTGGAARGRGGAAPNVLPGMSGPGAQLVHVPARQTRPLSAPPKPALPAQARGQRRSGGGRSPGASPAPAPRRNSPPASPLQGVPPAATVAMQPRSTFGHQQPMAGTVKSAFGQPRVSQAAVSQVVAVPQQDPTSPGVKARVEGVFKVDDDDEMAELKARCLRVTSGHALLERKRTVELSKESAAQLLASSPRALNARRSAAGGGVAAARGRGSRPSAIAAAAATGSSIGSPRAGDPTGRPAGLPSNIQDEKKDPPLLRLQATPSPGQRSSAVGKAFVIGHPLVDLSATVDIDQLQVWNLEIGSVDCIDENDAAGVMRLTTLAAEFAAMPSAQYNAGGSALNAARVCAWGLGAGYTGGSRVRFAGAIGDDSWGEVLLRKATRDGVDFVAFPQKGKPTGLCICAVTKMHSVKEAWRELPDDVDAGTPTMVACSGAGSTLCTEYLHSKRCEDGINASEMVILGAYLLCSSAGAAQHTAERAHQAGKVVSLIVGAPILVQEYGYELDKILPYVDFLFMNESSAEALAVRMGWGGIGAKGGKRAKVASFTKRKKKLPCFEIATMARDLPKRGGSRLSSRVVVITRGALPTVVADGRGWHEFYTPQTLLIIDSTGCGDAFVGGFLAGVLRGWGLQGCVTLAQLIARHMLFTRGVSLPRHPAPKTPEAARKLLDERALDALDINLQIKGPARGELGPSPGASSERGNLEDRTVTTADVLRGEKRRPGKLDDGAGWFTSGYSYGDRVRYRDKGDHEWITGFVEAIEGRRPKMAQKPGGELYFWDHVELAPAPREGTGFTMVGSPMGPEFSPTGRFGARVNTDCSMYSPCSADGKQRETIGTAGHLFKRSFGL